MRTRVACSISLSSSDFAFVCSPYLIIHRGQPHPRLKYYIDIGALPNGIQLKRRYLTKVVMSIPKVVISIPLGVISIP